MAVVRRSPLDPYPVVPKYLQTRNTAFHIAPSQFTKIKIKNDEVYGVVVDMPLGPLVLGTLVCFINGAANLYYNHGEEYTGAAMKYKNVVQTARNLVGAGNRIKSFGTRTSAFPLPVTTYKVYLLTKRGVYGLDLDLQHLKNADKELRAFNYFIQNTMQALRTAQMHDKQNAQSDSIQIVEA